MNIAVIPGFVGTDLYDSRPLTNFVSRKVWPNKFRLSQGGVALLDLAPDGTSSGALAKGETIRSTAPEAEYYGPLVQALSDAGHRVEPLGWDWRKDMLGQGDLLQAAMLGLFRGEPFAIVAHSAGGLVAKIAVGILKAHGHYEQLKQVIYLGTPHYGTFYVVSSLCRQAPLYKSLVDAAGWNVSGNQASPSLVLDTVLAHFVSIWQLLPAWGYGPFWDADEESVSRLYVADFWAGVNVYVTQQRLDNARAFWGAIKTLVFRDKEVFIAGTEQTTPSDYSYDKKNNLLLEAVDRNSGDDTVEKRSALPSDAGAFLTSNQWKHAQLPLLGDVQKKVLQFLGP